MMIGNSKIVFSLPNIILILAVILMSGLVYAGEQNSKVLSEFITDIKKLQDGGISDSLIIAYIKGSYSPGDIVLNKGDVIALTQNGIHEPIISFLLGYKETVSRNSGESSKGSIDKRGSETSSSPSPPINDARDYTGEKKVTWPKNRNRADCTIVDRAGEAYIQFDCESFNRVGWARFYVDGVLLNVSSTRGTFIRNSCARVSLGEHMVKVQFTAKRGKTGCPVIAGKSWPWLIGRVNCNAPDVYFVKYGTSSLRGYDPKTGETSPDPFAPEIKLR